MVPHSRRAMRNASVDGSAPRQQEVVKIDVVSIFDSCRCRLDREIIFVRGFRLSSLIGLFSSAVQSLYYWDKSLPRDDNKIVDNLLIPALIAFFAGQVASPATPASLVNAFVVGFLGFANGSSWIFSLLFGVMVGYLCNFFMYIVHILLAALSPDARHIAHTFSGVVSFEVIAYMTLAVLLAWGLHDLLPRYGEAFADSVNEASTRAEWKAIPGILDTVAFPLYTKYTQQNHSLAYEKFSQPNSSFVTVNPGPDLGLFLAYYFAGPSFTRITIFPAIALKIFGDVGHLSHLFMLMRPLTYAATVVGDIVGSVIFDVYKSDVVAKKNNVVNIITSTTNSCADSCRAGIVLGIMFSCIATLFLAIPILHFSWYQAYCYLCHRTHIT